ncbi:hypothetical protein EVJ58_g3540 [Rhodofomes roseus]|uniref:Uncharacterized protein n=1 Tax=Rhodofomes roseus TaxID=34475 RepID=A0A4Y9YLW1_9APHY|nr:hypothetical protein EVJ58_g3540 [Rhodofomes roseus]
MTTLDLDPVPYNISLTDQSAIVRFFPHRDGTIDGSWNVTYSGSSFADWSYDHTLGAGTSSHRTTLAGAYVVIDWAGTAVWLYGTAAADSYNVRIDQSSVVQGGGADIDGLLFSETGLAYGLHTVNLTVTAGEVSIIGATITVGMGESGTVLQPRNISATENSTPAMTENPFFVGDQSWSVMDLYTNQTSGYPSLVTSTLSSTLSFTLSEAVGFFIYGSDDWVQGLFTVAVTSDDEGATNSVTDNTIQYSPRALWTQLDLPKYMATGLNRSATYQVEITNLGAQFHFASVVAYDAVPSPSAVGGSGSLPSQTFGAGTTNTSATPSSSAQAIASISHTKSPTWAIITGAVLGCVVAALLILVIVIWFRRVLRRRHQRKEET